MEHIIEPNSSFDFSQLMCISPTSLTGGNYFLRILQKAGQKPLYIQPPKCTTKQGFIKSGKKLYTDLLFRNENEQFAEFLESLETFCKTQLFHNREKWFDSTLTEHDIEESFAPTTKLFKSGKFFSVKAQIPTRLGKCSLKIFNEEEQDIPPDEVRENVPILSILEIQGIRCSSRTFQLELEVKQLMVLKPVDLFESCLFTKSSSVKPESNPVPVPVPVPKTVEKLSSSEPIPPPVSTEVLDTDPISVDVDEFDITTTVETGDYNNEPDTVPPHVLSSTEENHSVPPPISTHPEHLGNSHTNSETGMDEIDIRAPTNDDVITLKKRNYVYYKMYKEAKQKARIARDLAIASYLEAKKIRNTFLEEQDVSDEDDEPVLEQELNEMKSIGT